MFAAALLLAVAPPTKIEIAPPSPAKERIGDWTVSRLGRIIIASTTNDVGAVFGTICTTGSGCAAFFNPTITCTDGRFYPALVNAPGGSFNARLECEKIDNLHVYSLPLEGAVAEAMSVGGILGIAFPMESGQFKVARFSLTGAARASARASQLAGPTSAPAREKASDSLTL